MSKKPVKKKKPQAVATHGDPRPPAVLKSENTPPAVSSGETQLLKLDLGCGPNKQPGFVGVDQYAMPGVDRVWDLGDRSQPWPWPEASVEAIHSSHFFEHLSQASRTWFMNEAYRILVPGGQMKIVTPYWASSRAYGDPTHAWPPIGEMTFYYFSREWRLANAPHTDKQWTVLGLDCDFDHAPSYNVHGTLVPYSLDRQLFEVTWYKEAAQDIIALMTKRAPPPSFK